MRPFTLFSHQNTSFKSNKCLWNTNGFPKRMNSISKSNSNANVFSSSEKQIEIPRIVKHRVNEVEPINLNEEYPHILVSEEENWNKNIQNDNKKQEWREAKRNTPEEDDEFKKSFVFQIDASNIFKQESKNEMRKRENRSEFEAYLENSIKLRGPLSVAQFMREALMNPKYGYYVNKENKVFGSKGDFITSPEISQMFGELIGIWCIATWEQMGMPKQIRIIECGPGRGTLMSDLLRATEVFPEFKKCVHSIHLVEGSSALRELQAKKLTEKVKTPLIKRGEEVESTDVEGLPVYWHRSFDEIPSGIPTLIIAQEFFDCLPVHQFEYTTKGWCEKFVELNQSEEGGPLTLALSRSPTTTSLMLLHSRSFGPENPAMGDTIDICPEGKALAEAMANRVNNDGGAAVIVDYGMDHAVSDSVKAIKDHRFVDMLEDPGLVDLSAVIDFSMLKKSAEDSGAAAFGTVDQGAFLKALGIEYRVEALLKNAKTPEQQERIVSSYQRLVDENEMGKVYKVISIANKSIGTPPGF